MSYGDRYSGVLIRDTSFKSSNGVAFLLNEAGREKFKRKSYFINCKENEWTWEIKPFDKINVPCLYVFWYHVKSKSNNLMQYAMSVQEYVDIKKLERENARAAKLDPRQTSLLATITPEVREGTLSYKVKNCRCKYLLFTWDDLQICFDCSKTQCLSCGKDFTKINNAAQIWTHFRLTEMDLRQIVSTKQIGKSVRCSFRPELSYSEKNNLGLAGGRF